MKTRWLLWTSLGAAGTAAAIGGAWMLSLPAAAAHRTPPPVPRDEAEALLAALKPSRQQRPVVAVIGINDATEATDYLMPYGVLRRADVADVVLLATDSGSVRLFPALTVQPDATVADFDARHPAGADYVIVPAMSRDGDPAVLEWLRSQSGKGARIIGVCAGAKVVAEAGLLDGRRATTHWYYVRELLDRHPGIRYVPDRRIVADGGVITTTGITASMPMALTLVEAIAGRELAESVGRDIGLPHWHASHDSEAFQFTRAFAAIAIRNRLLFWNRAELGIALTPRIDEVSLALVADAWSRTWRSRAVTFAPTPDPLESRSGVRIVPDRVAASWPTATSVPAIGSRPAEALDGALDAIRGRYGARTAEFVAMQLEYPAATNRSARAHARATGRAQPIPGDVR
ncbi:MAG TPA: DJ-1/PfpI family protein [Vicinamibacterales bacterium]